MRRRRGAILALIAAAVAAVVYGRAWRFDLQCDDLLVIRHWSRAELLGVWHGTWEPTHTFATFFRPVAASFYAGTFELFGYNATAHMLLSLAMLAAVAWLLALFVARESNSIAAGAGAALLYLVHPNVPWSTGTWVTNDFHKLTAISALAALVLWQRWRDKPASRWWLLAPFVVICFLVKEDGLMLIPALLCLQWTRAWLVGDVKAPDLSTIAAAGLVGAALVIWRTIALGEIGGFGFPPVSDVLPNLARGPLYAFTLHGSLSALTAFEKLTAIAAIVVVCVGIKLMRREERFLPVAGLLLMFWYDLPLALISNVMRYYMLTIAAVMVIVPVFLAFKSSGAVARKWPLLVAALMLSLAVSQARHQQHELDVFSPCGWAEHNCAAWVLEEVRMLPPEARAYVADTDAACAINPDARPRIGDNPALTWGVLDSVRETKKQRP